MDLLNQLKADTFDTLNALFFKIGEGIMSFLYAIIILFVGWMITKLILFVLAKTLQVSKIDALADKVNESDLFGKSDFKINISAIILGFVKWILALVFLIIAADIMEWKIISIEISNLLRYLPRLFSAIVLFMIGLYIANFLRKTIYGLFTTLEMSGAKVISSIVFYGLMIMITITSLNQANIDTSIITNNITILFGALLFTFTLAFGLGSKSIIQNLLFTFYSRKNYTIGDTIKYKNTEGAVIAIDNISLTIKTPNGKLIIPIKDIIETEIEILE